ncbi:AAA family ATPase [Nocardia sp. N13]|uniref:AAA family ATPase n=1 Tax=Nocardioides sp. N13(2025) TaxID=3453405 RepID=UPI003F767673
MGQLHAPELEPGPHRDLVEALHALHHRAGRPSVRSVASRAGCSHTTVFHVFSHPRLPSWGLLELVVAALAGDPAEFRELWLAATADGTRHVAPPARTIAGRRAELLVLRRHLEGGGGLLVVAGEAGIGKTTLVSAAAQQVSTFVARAGGLPLLADAPFALVAEALREVWLSDEGRWFREALAACPDFVGPSLARVLPELELPDRDRDDRFATARLVAAIQSTLASLATLRPLALVLEDVHWGDASSRAFVERQVVGGRGVPVVATIRSGESGDADEWLLRVRREATLLLNLPPLTEKETREQLRLLHGRRLWHGDMERIYRLGQGVPLFTEELSRSRTEDVLPERLVDSLSRHLDGLGPAARAVLVAAAVADRPLPPAVVSAVTSLEDSERTHVLRELVSKHLVADPYTTSDVAVRHPLLAATVRSQLVPGEAASAHRRLATALAESAHPSAAEVAEHWRGAQDVREELRWRVAAARTACSRLARDEEAVHWERTLELWPADGPPPVEAGITRSELLLEVVHAMIGSGRTTDAGPWVEEALALGPSVPEPDHALALRRASQVLADVDPDAAVRLAEEAIDALEQLGDRVEVVRALGDQSCALRGAGRYAEADEVVGRALALSATLDEPALHRDVLIERAWLDVAFGRGTAGLRAVREARLITVEGEPFSEVWLGTYHTDLLLMRCASGDEVADAADSGLAAVRDAGIESFILSTLLVCNVAEARIHEGAIASASRLVRPRTKDRPQRTTRFLHLTRAWVEVAHGDLEAADQRLEAVAPLIVGVSAHRQGLLTVQALCDLWRGAPARALVRIGDGIADETVTSWSPYTGSLLLLAARAAADVARTDPARRHALADRVAGWHRQFAPDPLSPDAPHAAASATRSTWRAELARLAGTAHVTHWTGAAEQWDLVGRPHEAAYCRWRAAEVALRDGQGVLAARLLRRAHAQARGHVPLLAAIDRCRVDVPATRVGAPTTGRAPVAASPRA